jgi:hypothetical protein
MTTAVIPIAEWAGAQNYAGVGNPFVGASAHRNSVALNLAPNNSTVQVTLDSVAASGARGYNIGNAYNTSGSSFTVPSGGSGKYAVTANVLLSGTNVLNSAYSLLVLRGASFGAASQIAALYRIATPGAGIPVHMGGSAVLDLVAGDIIYLGLFGAGNNSSSQVAVNVSPASTAWEITRITDASGSPVVGFGAATATSGGLAMPSGNLLNTHISASAAIEGSKIQAAGVSNAGAITSTPQTFGGAKTFADNVTITGSVSTTSGSVSFTTTPVTILDLATLNDGFYYFSIKATGSVSGYAAAIAVVESGAVAMAQYINASVTLSLSGTNLQGARASGGSISFTYSLIRSTST